VKKSCTGHPEINTFLCQVRAQREKGEGGLLACSPFQNRNLKTHTDFVDMMTANVYAIYPSAKISH
jgi:hypothetical protein